MTLAQMKEHIKKIKEEKQKKLNTAPIYREFEVIEAENKLGKITAGIETVRRFIGNGYRVVLRQDGSLMLRK